MEGEKMIEGTSATLRATAAGVLRGLLAFVIGCSAAGAATVVFNPASPETGPFPTDVLTVRDPGQKTGLRANMPLPDCGARPVACRELQLINQMDGFNVMARFHVRFSARVNADTVKDGIRYVALENLTTEENGLHREGAMIRANQVFYDPRTDTAYGKPDEILDQHRRYAILVTDAIRGADGLPVQADPAYTACVTNPRDEYCERLARLVSQMAPQVAPGRIVSASYFTTHSATSWPERARLALNGVEPGFRMAGPRAIFDVKSLAAMTVRAQVRSSATGPDAFEDTKLPVEDLYGTSKVAFGVFRSPEFRDENLFIAEPPTGAPITLTGRTNDLQVIIWLPTLPKPAEGYPVVLFGHGFADSRFGAATAVTPQMTAAGYAVVAFNIPGHGGGPNGQVILQEKNGSTVSLPAGGRGVDLTGDGRIDSFEGCPVRSMLRTRDCIRQAAVDMMQLVRTIRGGIDVDGDRSTDLDASKLYLIGHSVGASYGSIVTAVEPAIRAAALNGGGGTIYDAARTSVSFRPLIVDYALYEHPELLNKGGTDYDDNFVLRDQPARVNNVAGAVELHDFFDLGDWLTAPVDPSVYAPHFARSPLAGITSKPVLLQFAWGDQSIPNPMATALARASGLQHSTRFYRHDVARQLAPSLKQDPHLFLVYLDTTPEIAVALSAQNQMAGFFSSDGSQIPDPNDLLQLVFGVSVFETLPVLPEVLNF